MALHLLSFIKSLLWELFPQLSISLSPVDRYTSSVPSEQGRVHIFFENMTDSLLVLTEYKPHIVLVFTFVLGLDLHNVWGRGMERRRGSQCPLVLLLQVPLKMMWQSHTHTVFIHFLVSLGFVDGTFA